VLQDSGIAALGIGESDSANRAEEAAAEALNSPLLDVDVTDAKGALVNVIGSPDLTVTEAERVVAKVSEVLDPEAHLIWGAQLSEEMRNAIRVLVVLSGVHSPYVMGPTGRPPKRVELTELGLEPV